MMDRDRSVAKQSVFVVGFESNGLHGPDRTTYASLTLTVGYSSLFVVVYQ